MNYFDFMSRKMAPKPSHQRKAPSKAVRAGPPNPRPAPAPMAKYEPMEVTESQASDSMILRAFKFWQR